MTRLKEELSQAIVKVCSYEFGEVLSEVDDNMLCILEQIMGGSMLDLLIDEPDNVDDHVQEILDSDEDDWIDKDSGIQEIITCINTWAK